MTSRAVEEARTVVEQDLDDIVRSARSELAAMVSRRLLIVGGAGFLGHYLVQAVLHWNRTEPGARIGVTVMDSFVRGVPDWLTALDGQPGMRLVRHDITETLPADLGPHEFLIHAASIASPTYYRRYPIETMDANVHGLRILLDACARQRDSGHDVLGFLFYSSSEIYGDPTPDQIPTPETYRGNVSCTGPRACYDESKRFGETMCVNFHRERHVPIKVARPFNNYGPGLKISDRRVIPDFARDILGNRDLVMLSDGTARRTFCYVADAVVGYFKVLVNGVSGEAYNIGVESPEVSMAELARRMTTLGAELFGYQGRIVQQKSADADYLVDNPSRRCPVIEKARRDVGYNPTVSLDEGLRRSLIWYAANPTAADA